MYHVPPSCLELMRANDGGHKRDIDQNSRLNIFDDVMTTTVIKIMNETE